MRTKRAAKAGLVLDCPLEERVRRTRFLLVGFRTPRNILAGTARGNRASDTVRPLTFILSPRWGESR